MMTVRISMTYFVPWLALATLVAMPAFADDNVLYRCVDGQGNPAFTNSRQGFSSCTELGRYPRKSSAGVSAPAPRVQAMEPSPTPVAATPVAAASARPAVAAASTSAAAKPKVQRGAVYRFDNNGVVHYTNVRPTDAQAELVFTYAIDTCIACNVRSTVDWSNVALRLDEYEAEISNAAVAYGVDAALVRAIIHAESAYRSNARSHKGAQGLMQLIPATAERFGVTDVYDPAQNIGGGVQYLAFLLKRFDGDTRLAAAGYNAGEGAVDRHGGVPPYAETQVYVERVGILHARYRAALDAVSLPAATATAAATVTGASH
jgi:soluble lytic murein transglycosylase-like protein